VKFASFDMIRMHTNIPKIEVINVIKVVLDTNFVNTTIRNETPNLCKEVQKQNYFSFNGKHSIQIMVSNGSLYIIHFLTLLFYVYSKYESS